MPQSRRQFLAAAATAALAACSPRRRAADRATATIATATTAAPTVSSTAAPSGPAQFIRSGPADTKSVAFTFHGSGDLGLLRQLLDAAHTAAVPITIFAVGTWLDANPGVAAEITSQNHELANHTYTHPALGGLGRSAVAGEITRCRDALKRHAGGPGRWFRPSGIATPTPVILQQAGVAGYATVVGYDVDPLDYQDPGADAVARRVAAGLHAGAIVSLHTGHRGTVDAFAPMVTAARHQGLRLVTVSELLRDVA